MSKTVSLNPRLSEKTYSLSENRVYVVEVPKNVNKHTVKRSIEEQFEVEVEKVNTTNISGKTKRVMSITGKRYLNRDGKRKDIKKAYVTLKKGSSLPFFTAIEEEEQKEVETQKKIDKAIEKQTSKNFKSPKRGLSRLKSSKKKDKEK